MSAMKGIRPYLSTIVLVTLAAIAAAVLWIDRGSVSTDEAERRRRNLFEAWRSDAITEVVVTSEGRTARLARSASDAFGQRPWKVILDGVEHPAEEQQVDQFLGTLEFATWERSLAPDAVDRAAFGLDAPKVRIEVTMSGRMFALALGGPAPSPPGASYVEVPGRGVFVVTRELAAAMATRFDAFRSRRLVPYFSPDLRAIRVEGRGGPRRFVRAPWGGGRGAGFRWDGSTPEGSGRVAAVSMDRLLGALGRLEAETYLTDEAADRALEKLVTITLVPKDDAAAPGVIDLGGTCPSRPEFVVAVRRAPTRASACVAKSALDAFSAPAEQFVDRTLVGAPIDEVTEVKIEGGGRTLELARAGTGWRMREPEQRELDAATGRAFVEGLLRIAGSGLVAADGDKDLAALGLDPPSGKVRVVSTAMSPAADGGSLERIEVLEVGAPRGEVVHVRRLEDGVIAKVPALLARPLTPSPLSLRSPRIVDEPVARFRSLDVRAPGIVQRLERTDDGGWTLREPTVPGAAADASLANELATALGSLKAERWVAERDEGSYGLAKPRIVVEATLGSPDGEATDGGAGDEADAGAGGQRTLRIALGAATEDGAFARIDGDPAVFVVRRAFEQAASRWLLARSAVMVDVSTIERVTIASGRTKKRLVVERTEVGFRVAGAHDDPAATTRAAAVRDALGDLVPEGAVTVGKPARDEGLDDPELVVTVETATGDPASSGGKVRATVRLSIGASDVYRGVGVRYLRRDGVEATYAVAQARLRPLFEAFGSK